MAEVVYKPIWSEDGKTLSNVLVKDKLETYNVTDVWYDGTPMDDSKIDSDLVYVKYEGKYLVRNFEYGQVLQKDTMQEMRDLSSYEILLLKMGVYKHVQLNGYYEKGDTPEPINYKISSTIGGDNGYSIIIVGDIKMEHDFKGVVNVLYAGCKGDDLTDNSLKLQTILDTLISGTIFLPKGVYSLHSKITIKENREYVIKGEGRRSAGGVIGITGFHYKGEEDDCCIELVRNEVTSARSRADIHNLFIVNKSEREDVDGIKCTYSTGSTFKKVDIRGFRDNLVVNGYFFYNTIEECNFVNAKRHGVYANLEPLFNGTCFSKCRISGNGEWGFYTRSGLGEIISFENNWIETNEIGGLKINRAYVANIRNNYFEFNGENNIEVRNYSEISSNPSNCVANISGNKFRSRNGSNYISVLPNNSDKTQIINMEGNIIENNDMEIEGADSYIIYSSTNTNRVFINLKGNITQNIENKKKALLSNRADLGFFGSFQAQGCGIFRDLFPESEGNFQKNPSLQGGRVNVLPSTYNNVDSSTSLNIIFPEKNVADALIRVGRGTVTTGEHLTTFESGTSRRVVIDHNKGSIESSGYFNIAGSGVKRGLIFHNTNPEGIVEAISGTICLTSEGTFQKETLSGNIGWVKLVSQDDKIAEQSPNTSDGTSAESVLDELRDLKSKMITAGLLKS